MEPDLLTELALECAYLEDGEYNVEVRGSKVFIDVVSIYSEVLASTSLSKSL